MKQQCGLDFRASSIDGNKSEQMDDENASITDRRIHMFHFNEKKLLEAQI